MVKILGGPRPPQSTGAKILGGPGPPWPPSRTAYGGDTPRHGPSRMSRHVEDPTGLAPLLRAGDASESGHPAAVGREQVRREPHRRAI